MDENRFFPAVGNHDWHTGHVRAHLDYFTLPGNERYYAVLFGPVHLFVLDSNEQEPDGYTADSAQATWLQAQMAVSDAPYYGAMLITATESCLDFSFFNRTGKLIGSYTVRP